MMDLVTNRTQGDVDRLKVLNSIGWLNMTLLERYEWIYGTETLPLFWSDGTPMVCQDGPLYLYDKARSNKGAYNAEDMNRVENAVKELCGLLVSLPDQLVEFAEATQVAWDPLFEVPYDPELYTLTTKTNWLKTAIPTVAQLERYLGNVQTLRDALEYETDPLPESMKKLTWQGANAIEKALLGLEAAIQAYRDRVEGYMTRDRESFFYSGEIYCGEV